MRTILISAVLLLPLAVSAAPNGGTPKKIQCWTDDKGVRTCGDHVPPQFAKDQRDIYNSQGVVIGTQARQKTPEEIAEEERKAAEAAAAQRAAEDQAHYDRFLLDTYASPKELEAERDRRVQITDGRIGLVQKAIADNQKTLQDLHGRADGLNKAGKPVDDKLAKQIAKFEASLKDSQTSLDQLQKDRAATQDKFAKDIERYKQLKPGS
ncbi:MAG: hypothetical protein E6R07_07940 [Nevskiaceae bacterium]|nr:MAG: hypothetical protein E6R07_07940 [Nevskiaceae bacterium]